MRCSNELFSVSGETSRLAIAEQAAALNGEVLDSEVRAFVLALANDGIDSDIDWIQTIATVVAKKAPAEWTDADRDHFRTRAISASRIFPAAWSLYYADCRAAGVDSDAMRLTVTRADGTEYVRLVGVDRAQRDAGEDVLDDALARLTDFTGSPAPCPANTPRVARRTAPTRARTGRAY